MTPPKNVRELIDRCPPFLCFAIARRRGKALRLREISKASGVSERLLLRLKLKINWSGVKVDVVDAVMPACGVTIPTIPKAIEYVQSTLREDCPFPHLRRNVYKTLLRRMQEWSNQQP